MRLAVGDVAGGREGREGRRGDPRVGEGARGEEACRWGGSGGWHGGRRGYGPLVTIVQPGAAAVDPARICEVEVSTVRWAAGEIYLV